ncbi:MAG: methionyl-tRNA formyltransferase [Gemmataceae bacterium]
MRLVMMGTGLFAEPTFQGLLAGPHPVVGLFTQPDRATGVERGSTRQTGQGMKNIAQAHGVPVFQPESINTPEGVAQLRELAPDLIAVAAYGQILKPEVFGAAPLGCINVHASLLPRYRGAAPIHWAIYHGETQTGITIFRIGKGVDTGEILAQEALAIGPDETSGDVEARLAPLGARLLAQVVEQLAAGTAHAIPQDHSLACRAPRLKKEDGLLDWSRTAAQVACQVRAMHPWPTAYTFWHRPGQPPLRLIVHRSRPADSSPGSDPIAPGQIVLDPARLLVGASNGTVLEILELQPAGKKRMPAAEFLRGRKPQPGDRLGGETS